MANAAGQRIVYGQFACQAAAIQLSRIYGALTGTALAAADIPLREILITAEAGVVYGGGDNLVTSTNYGWSVSNTALTPARIAGPFNEGPVKLSDIWVAGAGATVHVQGIAF